MRDSSETNAAVCYFIALVGMSWAAVIVGRHFLPGWIVTAGLLSTWSFLLFLAGKGIDKQEVSAKEYKKEQEEID